MEKLFSDLMLFSYQWTEAIVNGLWLGALLAGLTLLYWKVSRKPEGATGYAIWWSAMIAVALLPILISLSSLTLLPQTQPTAQVAEVKRANSLTSISPSQSSVTRTEIQQPQAVQPEYRSTLPVAKNHAALVPTQNFANTSIPATTANNSQSFGIVVLQMLPTIALILWLLIAAVLTLRIIRAAIKIRAIKRNADRLDLTQRPRLAELVQAHSTKRRIVVGLSTEIDSPIAAGLGQPMVLMPKAMFNKLSEADIEAIMIHELSHLTRMDDWTKLGQKLLEAIMFFHPAVLWIGRQLDIHRELACDDLVVRATARPAEYARCLTRLAQMSSQNSTSLMPGALSGREQIFHRISRLVNGTPSKKISRKRVFSMIAALIITIVMAIQIAPVIALPVAELSLAELTESVGLLASVDNDTDEADGKSDDKKAQEKAAKKEPKKDGDISTFRMKKSDSKVRQTYEKQRSLFGDQRSLYRELGSLKRESNRLSEADRLLYKEFNQLKDLKDELNFQYLDLSDMDDLKDQMRDLRSDQRELSHNREREYEQALREFERALADERLDGKWLRYEDGDFFSAPKAPKAPRAFRVPKAPKAPKAPNGYWSMPSMPSMPPMPSMHDAPSAPKYFAWNNNDHNEGVLDKLTDWFGGDGTTINSGDGQTTITWKRGRTKIVVESDGELKLSDDGLSIKSISRGGYLNIYHKRGSWQREVEIEPSRDGELEYDYEVDGDRADFDDEGREWLAEIMLDVFRTSGLAAEDRVAVILKNDGVDGVLAETNEIESDWVKRQYLHELIVTSELSEDDHAQILRQIARDMESDYEKAELLISLSEELEPTNDLLREYLPVIESMESDYESRRVLGEIGADRNADSETVLLVLGLADQMDSDYEKAELLIDMARRCRKDEELSTAYTKACRRIDSSYELRRVLEALGMSANMSSESLAEIIKMAEMMDSDYEKAELLIDFADSHRGNDDIQRQLLQAASSLESDYETRRVLEAYDVDCRENNEISEQLMEIVSRMDSDYEKAELMLEWGDCARVSEAALQSYLKSVDRFDSDYEKRRVIRGLIDAGEVSEELAEALLISTMVMESDYERALILNDLIENCEYSESLEEKIEDVLDDFSSDYERDKLYRKLSKLRRQHRNNR